MLFVCFALFYTVSLSYTHMHTRGNMCASVGTHARLHTYQHIYQHTHTHTHTHTRALREKELLKDLASVLADISSTGQGREAVEECYVVIL